MREQYPLLYSLAEREIFPIIGGELTVREVIGFFRVKIAIVTIDQSSRAQVYNRELVAMILDYNIPFKK